LNLTRTFIRLRQVVRFARTAYALCDLPAACVLGLARGNPFNGSSKLGIVGQRWFPTVRIRPRRMRGASLWVSTSDLGQLISYEEIFVRKNYDLRLVPFMPKLIIDCGAHVGFFTGLAASSYPDARIMAFEPNPTNCCMLARQLQAFGTRVRLLDVAV